MPCGQMNMPPPKLFTTLPSGPNWTIGSVFESRHSSPKRAGSSSRSHRTTAQTCRPSGSMTTLPTAPIGLPLGSWAQPSAMRYGLGSPCAATRCCPMESAATASAARIPTPCIFRMSCTSSCESARIIRRQSGWSADRRQPSVGRPCRRRRLARGLAGYAALRLRRFVGDNENAARQQFLIRQVAVARKQAGLDRSDELQIGVRVVDTVLQLRGSIRQCEGLPSTHVR